MNTLVNVAGRGNNDGASLQVDRVHGAGRASLRPVDSAPFGSYSQGLFTGLISAGMTGPLPIWEMKWGSDACLCLFKRMKVSIVSTTAFAAGVLKLALYKASDMTALDGTNGVSLTFAGKSTTRATRMASVAPLATFSILSTSASGLTGGTKTLEDQAFAAAAIGCPATAGTQHYNDYLFETPPGEQPVELVAGEGLVLMAVAVPATGTWTVGTRADFDAVDPETWLDG